MTTTTTTRHEHDNHDHDTAATTAINETTTLRVRCWRFRSTTATRLSSILPSPHLCSPHRLSHGRVETARKCNINTVTTTLSRSVRSSSGVPSLGIRVYTLAPPRTRRIRIYQRIRRTLPLQCYATVSSVSPPSRDSSFPLVPFLLPFPSTLPRETSPPFSLFSPFSLLRGCCVVTRIRTRASRASLLDKARFLLCPFSPSLFLLIYSILSFYLLIILPRQIVRFAYFLYLSICIPNDFIKRLLSFSRDAFRGIA